MAKKAIWLLKCFEKEQKWTGRDFQGTPQHKVIATPFEPGATPLPTGHSTGLNYRPIDTTAQKHFFKAMLRERENSVRNNAEEKHHTFYLEHW